MDVKIKKTADMVYLMLTLHPETRSSDRLLIRRIYEDCCDVNPWLPWTDVVMNKNLPSFETIRRARQKIQQEHEDLRAEDDIERMRIERQEQFIKWARGEER